MEKYLAEAFKQWDRQVAECKVQLAFIELNNLYLSCERGSTKMSITVQNNLYQLVSTVYPYRSEPVMSEYWQSECEKLPDWFSV